MTTTLETDTPDTLLYGAVADVRHVPLGRLAARRTVSLRAAVRTGDEPDTPAPAASSFNSSI